jgi:hypothetical protein
VQPEALAQAWSAELDRQGPIVSVGAPLTEPVPPAAMLVKIPVTCERGGFTLVAAVTEQGQLLSLQLAPRRPRHRPHRGSRPPTPIRLPSTSRR